MQAGYLDVEKNQQTSLKIDSTKCIYFMNVKSNILFAGHNNDVCQY